MIHVNKGSPNSLHSLERVLQLLRNIVHLAEALVRSHDDVDLDNQVLAPMVRMNGINLEDQR